MFGDRSGVEQFLIRGLFPAVFDFFRLKLNGVEDSDPLIKEKAADARVLMIPGESCSPLVRRESAAIHCPRIFFCSHSVFYIPLLCLVGREITFLPSILFHGLGR